MEGKPWLTHKSSRNLLHRGLFVALRKTSGSKWSHLPQTLAKVGSIKQQVQRTQVCDLQLLEGICGNHRVVQSSLPLHTETVPQGHLPINHPFGDGLANDPAGQGYWFLNNLHNLPQASKSLWICLPSVLRHISQIRNLLLLLQQTCFSGETLSVLLGKQP